MLEIPGRIPLAIHPFFWLFAALIGWLNSGTLLGTVVWVGIILVSVAVHEFGHALTAVFFKQKARIQLMALGGLTTFDGPKLAFWKQFLITLNGPLFGFCLFILATFLLKWNLGTSPIWIGILKTVQLANLFWTIINLLPVLPLDGGQLLRIVLEASFGFKGFKASLLAGGIIATLLALYFFLMQAFLVGAFFFLFAFQSFDTWRKTQHATRQDREDDNKKLLAEAEITLQEGNREEAKRQFHAILEKTPDGLIASAAAQYLAFIYFQEKNHKEAYDLLLRFKKNLSEDSLCLLHQLAAEQKNYPLVSELAAPCFQVAPSQEMALRNARACAHLKQPKPAGGWLQTAWQYGTFDLNSLLQEEDFASLKDDPQFRAFTDPLKL